MDEPNQIDPSFTQTQQKESKCTNCGGSLQFSPGTSALECPYCGTVNEFAVGTEAVEELDLETYLRDVAAGTDKLEVVMVKCEGCGAEQTMAPNVVADECAFCATPLVVSNGTTCSLIEPKSLLPFKWSSKESFAEFHLWLKKRFWAPSNLKKYAAHPEKLKGMYVPFWTFDAEVTTDYTGQRGTNYTETYTAYENGKPVTRTRTKIIWTYAAGRVHDSFDDVLVIASESLPFKLLEKLEPWDLNELVPFSEKYLTGFRAEAYHVALPDGWANCQVKMEEVIRQTIKYDIGGDHQRISSMNPHYQEMTFKHILLPVWMCAYRYKNKVYRYLVNARTGEVQGEYPKSWIKITIAILLGVAVIGGIIYLVNRN